MKYLKIRNDFIGQTMSIDHILNGIVFNFCAYYTNKLFVKRQKRLNKGDKHHETCTFLGGGNYLQTSDFPFKNGNNRLKITRANV